jgi:hypothetical protein
MLGYNAKDLEEMTNSIHDAKLYYLLHADLQQGDEDPIVDGLLKAQDFLQGLWAEGYFE